MVHKFFPPISEQNGFAACLYKFCPLCIHAAQYDQSPFFLSYIFSVSFQESKYLWLECLSVKNYKRGFFIIIQMHPDESELYSRAVVCVNRAF